MKKSVALLLTLVLLLFGCFTACTKDTTDASSSFKAETTDETKKDEQTETPGEGSTTQKIAEVNTTRDASGQSKLGGFKSFRGKTLDGEDADVSVFKNAKLTVVNVWGTFCSPCIEELPYLGEIAAEYEKKGVQIIGIVGDAYTSSMELDSAVVEDAKGIVKDTGAKYMHIVPDEEFFVELVTNMTAFPTTYFLDSDGNFVGQAVVGALDKGSWEAKLDSVLSSME